MGICSRRLLVATVLVASVSLAVANLHDDWDIDGGPQHAQFTRDSNGVALAHKLLRYVAFIQPASTYRRNKHDEIDFEFIGDVAGQPYTIHTNLFAANVGGKEVEFKPWFDATIGFHNYTISWSSCMVVWYIDEIPIRVFRNYEASHGVPYPTSLPMYGYASIWNTTAPWATHGGRVKTDWSKAPFVANYNQINLDICECSGDGGGCVGNCLMAELDSECQLSPVQVQQMRAVQAKYKIADYCHHKGQTAAECRLPQY
ncbi:hypothetical protein PR202_gb24151 [Eleusine coracana subsp. coracana]|uniref:GH16 domain-containing protein n=1 Tax=Eleusine coracana subsp. coracana TaxID=191504 RepID=A0AAV5FLP5_ELECO|nr:hypothetical protein PR202_gb24151 [Eleusine coracana subsp. coracana]